MRRSVRHGCCVALAVGLTGITPAQAQYPNKSVRLIVPFPPGGATDALGRVIALPLSEALGRPVVVENRPGAGTNLGAEIAAKSPPDGYTLLLGGFAQAISATLYSKLNYDFIRDFAPVSLLASTSLIMVVHPSVPAKSVKELIALAEARPGQLDYVSSGSGSPAHLAAALFTAVIQHVKSGKLRGLASTSARRSPLTPDLPTISEMGVTGYEIGTWDGLLAPVGTPNEVISRLHAKSVKALRRQDVKERLDAIGIEPIGTTPEQFGAHIRSEIDKWAKIVKASGAHVE